MQEFLFETKFCDNKLNFYAQRKKTHVPVTSLLKSFHKSKPVLSFFLSMPITAKWELKLEKPGYVWTPWEKRFNKHYHDSGPLRDCFPGIMATRSQVPLPCLKSMLSEKPKGIAIRTRHTKSHGSAGSGPSHQGEHIELQEGCK